MARKTLLTESEIRRFLKLASMPTVGDEDALEDEMADLPGDEEGGEMELGDMGDDGADIDGTDEASVEKLVQALVDTISDVTGVPVSMDSSGEEGGDDDLGDPMDDMGEPAGLGGEEEVELGAVEDEPVPGGRDTYMEEDQIVAEVARRVAERLAQKAQKEELADTLAERIMNRLTK